MQIWFSSLNPASAMVFGAAAMILLAIAAAAIIGIAGRAIAKRSGHTFVTRIMMLSPQVAIINTALALVAALAVHGILSVGGTEIRFLLATAAMAVIYFGLGYLMARGRRTQQVKSEQNRGGV